MEQSVFVVLDEAGAILGVFANKEVAAHSVRHSYVGRKVMFDWVGPAVYAVTPCEGGKSYAFRVREYVIHDQVQPI